MATTLHNPVTTKFHGHVGPYIYYVVRNQQRIRSMPSKVHNPRSPKQTAHRTRFSAANSLAATFRDAYPLGYHKNSQGLDPRSAFVKQIYHEALSQDSLLDPNKLKISQGSLVIFQPTRTDYDGSRLTLRWALGNGQSADRLCVCVYNYTRGFAEFRQDLASRGEGRVSITIREDWREDHLYVYCFWHNPLTHKVSTSVVATEINNPDTQEKALDDLTKHLYNLSIPWKSYFQSRYLRKLLLSPTNITPLSPPGD
jgi:hypothetical protein